MATSRDGGVTAPLEKTSNPGGVPSRESNGLRLVDIAALLGVSKQRADQLRRDSLFPPPSARYALGFLWSASDVQAWLRLYRGGAARWGPRSRPAGRGQG